MASALSGNTRIVRSMAPQPTYERPALVVNASSRTGADAYEIARDLLTDLGVPLTDCYAVRDPTRLGEVLDQVINNGCDLVIVGGGDGTLSSAVDQLARHGITLGVLPLGTANDLARTLQIPTDVRAACRTIAQGKLVDIDVGGVGDHNFLNAASIGLSVGVTQALTSRLKRWLGPLAYPVASLQAYRMHAGFTGYLEFPDGDHPPITVDDVLQVAIGNGRHYGGGNTMSPTAGIDDHMLDVYAIRRGGFRDHVSVARRFRKGTFVNHSNVTHLKTRRILLRADPEQRINLDGEVVATTPQLLEVHRNAINVLVPQESTAAEHDGDGDGGRRARRAA